ncbi:porin [Luteimonas sp. S4-F44]|uniref:porin n=1 Tax=Luteimonas sp. S4-F44 TaxID=2925842 RepID=UPI001F52E86D|nr:porin [Luteimonas sp. S4-F44]UNK42228.1 porin [Luteimonas sp. S4-F44]
MLVRHMTWGAIGVALLPAVAHAQSTLKPFAVVDVFYQHVNTGDTWQSDVGSNGYLASRFGLVGDTAAGPVKLSFKLEAGFNPSEGTLARTGNALFNRQAWAGIAGGWGELRYGTQNALMFVHADRLDVAESGTHASAINNFAWYTYRTPDTLSYTTPKLGAWQLSAYWGRGDDDPHRSGPSREFAVTYDRGSWQGVISAQTLDGPAGNRRFSMFAGGNYRSGDLTWYLGTHSARWGKEVDIDAAELSVKYTLNDKDIIGAGVGILHDRSGLGDHARQIGVLYRRTFNAYLIGYAGYNVLHNRGQANYRFAGAATGGLPPDRPGADLRGLQLGFTLML